MRILIEGATGGIGQQLCEQAVVRGHAVTAIVRTAREFGPSVQVVVADALDARVLTAAMAGCDAVISTLGHRLGNSPHTLLETGARATVAAMHEAKVDRLLIVSAAMLFPGLMPWIVRQFLKVPAADSRVMEEVVRASDLAWTIARPPRLTDKAGRGMYRTRVGRNAGSVIARADVAKFLLDACEQKQFVHEIVGVAA